ncbi:glutathione S-transferase family protein [Novosphingobium aquimarinum]|uniref:glutathione S-transferase family protein n=1 Tax=Novosphingobium aquimarinum TaxID=2682494 RepID=UPI0012EB774D|nr:glutathione S-transferase family protein [Novosphingobium aquimarinum]
MSAPTSLELYGHPFSSYTWKALIALYSAEIPFEFKIIDAEHPEHGAFVARAGPAGKFPVLRDGETVIFEATAIVDYLALHHAEPDTLIPLQPEVAIGVRMIDRVFDNYVMANMQEIVNAYLRDRDSPDQQRVADARERLSAAYAWLEGWLQYYPAAEAVTLVECAAAPALFYADWVHPIVETFPRLRAWRAHLLALPAVARCIEDARPYRAGFPPGAPDRD